MQFPNMFYVDVDKGPATQALIPMFLGDALANRVGVYLYKDGEPFSPGGSAFGRAVLSGGETVSIQNGVVSGNQVYVDLPSGVYAEQGPVKISVSWTDGTTTTTVLEGTGNVRLTETGTIIDPGTIISDVSALIQAIEDARDSLPPEYTDLLETIAEDFSESEDYSAGEYVWYSSVLYRFTADHSAGTWTGTDAVSVTVCGETAGAVRYDIAQSLTAAQKAQALTNIGATPDTTLSVAGRPADAGATGAVVGELRSDVDNIEDITVLTETTQSAALIADSDIIRSKLINTNGAVADFSNAAWRVSGLVDISEYDSLIVTAGSGYNHLLYAFYDENETYISNSGLNSGSGIKNITSESVSIPAGAKYIRVAKNANANMSLRGVTSVSVNSASKKWHGKKWTVVGDSLTAINTRTTKHYFDYVAEATGITVVNMGDSGSGYRAEQDQETAFYQRITNVPTDSDVVTIFGSFNDGLTDLGTATDSGTTTIGGCINTTIDNLYSVFPTVQLGIVSPTPWVGANPYNHPEANAYAELLEAICKRRSIPFLNLYYESNLRPWDSTFRTLAYSKDDGNGVHPDETGHKIIASRFLGFLDSLIV